MLIIHFEGHALEKNREFGFLIDDRADATHWHVEVPGLVDGLGGPYRKYMVPEDDTCRLYNAPCPEVVPGFITVGQAKRNHVTGSATRPTSQRRCSSAATS